MGLYNFKQRFVPFILDGRKQHTIRATRKNGDKVGNMAHLYTGLRTKKAKLLGRYRITKIEQIEITRCGCGVIGHDDRAEVRIDGVFIAKDEREKLARLDGFESFSEMEDFWKGRLPFKGQIIHWQIGG